MIDCEFRKIPKYPILESSKDSTLKEGRYHNSHFNLEDNTLRVVGAYIEFDFLRWIGSSLGEEKIIQECVDFLNVLVTPRKKSKKPYYRYGFLKPFQCQIKKDEKDHFYIVALLTTNDRDNKHFWDENKKEKKSNDAFISSDGKRRGRQKKNA